MKFKNSIWTFIIFFIIVYAILVFLGDINSIKKNIEKFDWKYLLFAVGFFSIAIGVRIMRWNFWFEKIGPNVPFKIRTIFYLSGYAFLMSPARIGEAIRSYFIKRDYEITQSRTVPLVLVERFYDLVGFVILISIAIIFVPHFRSTLVILLSFITIAFILSQNKKLITKILSKLSKIKFLSKFAPNAEESANTLYEMLHVSTFIRSSLISALSVFLDILGAFMIILGVGIDIDLPRSILVISSSVVVGALSFIPGGLGVQEGGMIGLLKLYGIEYSKSFVFVTLYRISYSVLLVSIGLTTLRIIANKKAEVES